jgi:hypothetical protein
MIIFTPFTPWTGDQLGNGVNVKGEVVLVLD